MTCPKCRFEQGDAVKCAKCGIIVARYRERPRSDPADLSRDVTLRRRRDTTPKAEAPSSSLGAALADPRRYFPVLAVAAFAVWFYWPRAPEVERPPVAVATPRAVATTPMMARETPPPPEVGAPPAPPVVAEAVVSPPETFPTATCPLSDHGYGAPPSRDRVSSSWYTTPQGYADALREQDRAAAPVLLYVYTDWCPYCKALERNLFSSGPVDSYLRDKALKVRINPETSREARALADQLGVSGYPTLFLVTPGNAPERISPYRSGTDIETSEQFISGIESRMQSAALNLLRQGSSQRRGGKAREAIATLTRAARVRPEDPMVYLERAAALADDGSLDAAWDDLARAARLRPGDMAPFSAAEGFLSKENRWDEAVACWTSFLETNPSNADAYLWRAAALSKRGLSGLSRADVTKACELGSAQACRSAALE